jgi:hypothetical protein
MGYAARGTLSQVEPELRDPLIRDLQRSHSLY